MTTLLVIAPANVAPAEHVIGHDVVPVDLDTTGAAVTSPPLDIPASVRAYDADGKLLGETPVQPSKAALSPGLPGESPATRSAIDNRVARRLSWPPCPQAGPHSTSHAAISVRWSGEEPGQLGMILEPK
jgi:hypothetical protein